MSKTKTLRQKLADYDQKGIRFYEAKKVLLSEGYSEDEIVIAAASEPFDKKPNVPKQTKNLFEGADEEAIRNAARELANRPLVSNQENIQQTRMNLVGSTSHPLGSVNPNSVRDLLDTSEDIGFPIIKFTIAGVFIFALSYGISTTSLISFDTVLLVMKFYICIGIGWIIFLLVTSFINSTQVDKKLAKLRGKLGVRWYIVTTLQFLFLVAGFLYILYKF